MAFKIVSKTILSEKVFQIEVHAPQIAKNRKAGHFVILRLAENGERIPLTIVASNIETGTITLIAQIVGTSSYRLSLLNVGDEILDVLGPLGNPTEISNYGTVICAGGGVGIAPLLPIAQALKNAGNNIISVLAARSKELIILEDEMRKTSDEVIITTDDGSYGSKGLITEAIENVIKSRKVDHAVIIGPAIMMKFASQLTLANNIPTTVSLNTLMLDGTGMCGACRCSINNENKFVCVDGPEFDAALVNFDEILLRLKSYKKQETESYQNMLNK